MQIPVYSAPQVAPQLTPDARLDPHMILRGAGDAFGIELGEKGQQAAGQLAHIQDTADQTVATDIFLNQVQKPGQQILQKATQVQGKDVLKQSGGPWVDVGSPDSEAHQQDTDLVGSVQDGLSNLVASAKGAANNQRQKDLIDSMATAYNMQVMPQVQNHQDKQLHGYEVGNAQDTITMANQSAATAAANGQFDIAASFVHQARAGADNLATLTGIPVNKDDPSYQALQVGAASPIHTTIAQGLITAGRPQDAVAYLKEHTSEMTPGAIAQMSNLAKNASNQQQAQDAANDIWDKATNPALGHAGPPNPNGEVEQANPFAAPPSYSALLADLRDRNLPPEVFNLAKEHLREQQAAKAQEVRQTQTDFFGTAVKAKLDGQPSSAILNQDNVLAMPDSIQADLKEKLHAIDKQRQAEANQDLATPQEIASRGFLFNDLLGRMRAGTLTKNDVYTNADALGKGMTGLLVSTIGDMQLSQNKVQHYAVDHDLLTSSLRRAGLIKDKETPEAKSLEGDLHAKIMLIQSASQQPWSQENTQKLIDAEIQPIITDPSNHWWTSETKAPAFKAEDQVPQAFINLAQKRNPALSKNAITQAYYLAKSQNLLNDDGIYKAAK